jgi:single-strand DNA-binding protein|nr:MAG TPA: Single strand binding protein [Caudoviricetes sp.]
MNDCKFSGRPTRDPEIRYTDGAQPVAIARYTLAVDRRYKKDGGQQADFLSIVAFGKTAEFVEKYIKKGVKVIVECHA